MEHRPHAAVKELEALRRLALVYTQGMNALDRLEGMLQELMERPAALLSSKRLHPLKLAAALTREFEARAIPLVDRVIVPDSYELWISQAEWSGFDGVRPRLEAELADYLTRLAAERALTLAAPICVRMRADSGLRQGDVRAQAGFQAPIPAAEPVAYPAHNPTIALPRPVRSDVPEGVRPPFPPQPASPAALVLLGPRDRELARFALDRPLVRIGRRSSNEIALADTKVSREHARVERAGLRYYLVDLGSTNGVRINGRDAQGRCELSPGDVIEIGLQRLRFEA